MAQGDIFFFNEALEYMFNWAAADDIKVAILDNTTTPAITDVTPALGDYTQVGAAGTYTAGGTSIGTWDNLITQSGGTVTFDSATNPSWASDPLNDTDAFWALIYNDTDGSDAALAYVDLGGPLDMTADTTGVIWNASGISTIS